MVDRCWGLRMVRDGDVRVAWGSQAVVFERHVRRDGIPVWRLGPVLGPPRDNYKEAEADGEANHGTLPRARADSYTRTGGLALEVSDLLDPAEETIWRLGGRHLVIVYTTTKPPIAGSDQRHTLGLAEIPTLRRGTDPPSRKGEASTVLVKRIGTVSAKQLRDFQNAGSLGFATMGVASVPRLAGKVVKG